MSHRTHKTNSAPHDQTSIYIGQASQTPFNTKEIRSNFVSKVYSILFVQILTATCIIALVTFHQPTKNYFKSSGLIWLYVALGVALVVYFILICVECARRTFPLNFILLGLITLSFGLVAAIFSSNFRTNAVLYAFGATAAATFIVMLLAKFSPFDLTTCGCGLCVLSLVHLIGGIILVLVLVPAGHANLAQVIIAASGAFLVSLYLMFDLQLIMGGRANELSPEEYILGAVLLYTDIIYLFQYLLILFGND